MTTALALDQSTKMGWAIGSTDGSRPVFGVETFSTRGSDEGPLWLAYEKWLDNVIFEQRIGAIFFEQTFLPPNSGFDSRYKQFGFTIITQLVAARAAIPAKQILISDWRGRFIGTSRAPAGLKGDHARRWFKDQALKGAAERGWYTDSHDAAEALGILDYGLCTLDPAYESRTGPLFRRAEATADERRRSAC